MTMPQPRSSESGTQVTDAMVTRACDAYQNAVDYRSFRPHDRLMRAALEAVLADFALIPTNAVEGESIGLENA